MTQSETQPKSCILHCKKFIWLTARRRATTVQQCSRSTASGATILEGITVASRIKLYRRTKYDAARTVPADRRCATVHPALSRSPFYGPSPARPLERWLSLLGWLTLFRCLNEFHGSHHLYIAALLWKLMLDLLIKLTKDTSSIKK